MKTRRSSLPDPAPVRMDKLNKKKKGGIVKKPIGKQPRRVVVRQQVVVKSKASGRSSKRATRSAATAAAAAAAAVPAVPSPPAAAAAAAEPAPSGSKAATTQRLRSTRRRSSLAAAKAPSTHITDLSAETLFEVFIQLSMHQGFCREVLPLVCKRFRDLLAQPSTVWQTVQINFLEKSGSVAYPDTASEEELEDLADMGRRRRLLHSAVERWLKPRASAVRRLLIMFSAMDPTHSFSTRGHGLRQLLDLVARGLQELHISSCSDIFHGRSFADLARLQQLETLAVTCISAKLTSEDLAPLEQLKKLKTITIHCSRQHEEAMGPCFAVFPEVLFKLKGLRELAFTSTGVTHIPTGISRLKNLTALDVSGCPISFLPQQLWKCSELRHVRVNGTNMVLAMPHVWEPLIKLQHLESLELRETKTRCLPPLLNGLKNLTSLDLSDNMFEHTSLQEEDTLSCLQHMPQLKRLGLRRCLMSTLPASLCHLSKLELLDVSHNFLVDLPEGLWLMRSLKELLAQGNTFPKIPEVLAKLPSLEVTDLSFCIYLEAATSMDAMAAEGFKKLRCLDLRKMLGEWKLSSQKYLISLDRALAAQGRGEGIVKFQG